MSAASRAACHSDVWKEASWPAYRVSTPSSPAPPPPPPRECLPICIALCVWFFPMAATAAAAVLLRPGLGCESRKRPAKLGRGGGGGGGQVAAAVWQRNNAQCRFAEQIRGGCALAKSGWAGHRAAQEQDLSLGGGGARQRLQPGVNAPNPHLLVAGQARASLQRCAIRFRSVTRRWCVPIGRELVWISEKVPRECCGQWKAAQCLLALLRFQARPFRRARASKRRSAPNPRLV